MIAMRLLISTGILTLMLGGATPVHANEEDAKLAAFFDRYFEAECEARPLYATMLGEHRFDDRLDDLSKAARAKGVARTRATLDALPKSVDYAKLTRGGQIDFEILKFNLERDLWLNDNANPFQDDPRVYSDYISDSVFLLFTQSTLPKPRNIANAAQRIRQIPKIVAAAKESIGSPAIELTDAAIRRNQGAISFYEKGIYELAGMTPGMGELAEPCTLAVTALKDYQHFLETVVKPRSTGNWRIGKDKFAKKIQYELDAGLTADEVLALAEKEAVRVEGEMVTIARQLWHQFYPKLPLPPDDAKGRRVLIQRVLDVLNRDHGKVDGLVRDAQGHVEAIKKFIAEKDLMRLPNPDRCQIIEMPEFQRGFSVAYLNPAPPLDVKANSFYAIAPPPSDWDDRKVESFLQEYNRGMLQILTIHEAYPGHYVQLEYSNRHPSKLRRVLSSGVFAEGWAVYTEQMMLDQGFSNGDLGMRLQQLKWYLRAVTNAILDHRMHCTNMTDDEAMRLLVEGAYQTEGEARGKVLRAKQSSCQLSTYFVGRMAFYNLRQSVSREQGAEFHLGRFHEAVLDHGTLPVKYLPELVRTRLKQPR
ncbi:DUF885 domain-containing protein [Tuwongella immobilis]|uniref:DUF885 domain-containing protein n=1 Tax=Tuwongella immobilis TaxID=692036 RepID=A0A6C2YRW0_9BACT|nr:DUF885 domain-containing protein [Tuwongella immobilis]VIP04084.1 Uncharacterized protein OS=Singulisphaera acidiphila (strain ATCC BAA-1392 / DSM 18658 / VKM B-2454 / MOB10) GN=Sinac_3213 PE=4 SV=1: DUF885 [Tuwongella immobilis]VTS05535.1 Uncharacterized protein OS=Singulisphaera acidiphila (strain ATCC BAA-1392 / DSM 18658 / VKM B-2454 / MOB10) GN=Sinac_3213 PE=4 SV=1: DUF885 [Tuwongella immobilis]